MVSRRDFLKAASIAGSAAMLHIHQSFGKPLTNGYFGLNNFIESHPDAVFIFKVSGVSAKTDSTAIKTAGQQLGASLFVSKTGPTGAYDITANVAIKPNITSWVWNIIKDNKGNPLPYTFDQVMGIQADANFVEGIIGSLSDLTIAPANIYVIDGNYARPAADSQWYSDMADRSGVNLQDFSGLITSSSSEIVWRDVPNPVFYKRIPYLWPVMDTGVPLINIAKFKTHSMGLTGCAKNLQGTNAQPYIKHCSEYNTPIPGVSTNDIVSNAFTTINSNYQAHRNAGIPRWNTPGEGSGGGRGMETHHARCLDNNSTVKPLLNILEGIYGRECNGFVQGPGSDGRGVDIMSNIIIFGKNALLVDMIGTYLAGHEPGNFGLFHIAKERGLTNLLNPHNIPLYEWSTEGGATLSSLGSFTRTPLRTKYLYQAGEPTYHMVNEPFDYPTGIGMPRPKPAIPDVLAIEQNFPNPFNPSTSIQFYIPKEGNVRLEIFDIRGQLVDVLVDSYMPAGDHLNVWNSAQKASGTYFYRLLYGGISQTKSMILIK